MGVVPGASNYGEIRRWMGLDVGVVERPIEPSSVVILGDLRNTVLAREVVNTDLKRRVEFVSA